MQEIIKKEPKFYADLDEALDKVRTVLFLIEFTFCESLEFVMQEKNERIKSTNHLLRHREKTTLMLNGVNDHESGVVGRQQKDRSMLELCAGNTDV